MIKKLSTLLFILSATSFLLHSCKKTKTGKSDNFDKSLMLTQIVDQIIIPNYSDFKTKANALKIATEAFLAAPNTATQAIIKDAYKAMHLSYMAVELFNGFGPAYTAHFESYINYFGGLSTTDPDLNGFTVDKTAIENNISSGTYNLQAFTYSSFYSQGLGTLAYLLFSGGSIDKFLNNATNRIKYTNDVVARLKSLTDKVVADWGTYRSAFISNTKSDVGSPIGNLGNQMAYQMDALKGPRIGWPLGKQSNGVVFPERVEGYYTENSIALAIANLKNIKKVFVANNSGKGFSDYLNALGKNVLSKQILNQFDLTISKLEAISDPLSTSLTSNASGVNAAYGEIQNLLKYIKTDMLSALSIQINFMDNDGD